MVVPISIPLRYIRYPRTALLSVELFQEIFTCPALADVTTRFVGAVGALVSPDCVDVFGLLGEGEGDLVTIFFTAGGCGGVIAGGGVTGGGVTPGFMVFDVPVDEGDIPVAPSGTLPPASITISGGV